MKKIITLIAVAFIATTMNAQMYAGLSVGYGLGAGKTDLGYESTSLGAHGANVYGSFGQGINIAGKAGYMFNDNFGFELGLDYFMGAKQTLYVDENETMEGKSTAMMVLPQFVIKTEMGIYSRFGIVTPFAGKTVITDADKDAMDDGSNVLADMEMESQGTFTLGFTAAFGYNYKINDKMNFFGELQYMGMTVKSGTSTITKYEVAGVDQLPNMTTSQIETEYVDEIDYTATQSTSEASKSLRSTSPFSSFGVNFGITMNF